jgi:hypothetical protein
MELRAETARVGVEYGEAESQILASHVAQGLACYTRPSGMAEFGFGWITLPGADVCVNAEAGCEEGDTSFAVDAWQLYRASTKWGVGAGLTLGLLTTTNAPRMDPEGVDRDHSRGYFLFDAIGRYYPYVSSDIEAWVGATTGLVVVSDRYESSGGLSDKPLVGQRGVTIRSEGFATGLAAGVAVAFAQGWTFGGSLRYGYWFLPQTPTTDALGDEASLTGINAVVSLGLGVAYRIVL